MKKQQIVILAVILFIMLNSSVVAISSNNTTYLNNPQVHIIEDVPYIKQKGHRYCMFACYEMLYKYFGVNTTKIEIMYNMGGGYSLGYKPNLDRVIHMPHIHPPYRFSIHSNTEMSQGTDDHQFLANLFGFTIDYDYPTDTFVDHFNVWKNYWTKLKQNIINNTPVPTCIDHLAWPLYKEIYDINFTPIFYRGAHMILIVGFNESNESVCFHDPCAGACNVPEKGTYGWASIKDFRKAVRRAKWDAKNHTCYELYLVKNITKPLSKEKRFEIAHLRNIERMKGNRSSYDGDFITKDYVNFGIKGLKKLKEDFSSNFTNMVPFYCITTKLFHFPLDAIIGSFQSEALIRNDVATYLRNISNEFENRTFERLCNFESSLLENESGKFDQLSSVFKQLKDTFLNNSIYNSIIMSKQFMPNIIRIIDELISIENSIIENNVKNM